MNETRTTQKVTLEVIKPDMTITREKTLLNAIKMVCYYKIVEPENECHIYDADGYLIPWKSLNDHLHQVMVKVI
jgi:hypothetical protein